jgi:hypothetical protein
LTQARRAVTLPPVTTEGVVAPDATSLADGERLFCYRHRDRETWIRCGRCDQPICPSCAMQGPVGFRCRECGTPAFDPLTSFTARQIVLGALVSLVAGSFAGLVASRVGFFGVFIAFFAGGMIAEAVTRVTGYKRGPVMWAIVFGGIVVGTAVAFAVDYAFLYAEFATYAEEEGWSLTSMLLDSAVWALIAAGAACVGAYSRLR